MNLIKLKFYLNTLDRVTWNFFTPFHSAWLDLGDSPSSHSYFVLIKPQPTHSTPRKKQKVKKRKTYFHIDPTKASLS